MNDSSKNNLHRSLQNIEGRTQYSLRMESIVNEDSFMSCEFTSLFMVVCGDVWMDGEVWYGRQLMGWSVASSFVEYPDYPSALWTLSYSALIEFGVKFILVKLGIELVAWTVALLWAYSEKHRLLGICTVVAQELKMDAVVICSVETLSMNKNKNHNMLINRKCYDFYNI